MDFFRVLNHMVVGYKIAVFCQNHTAPGALSGYTAPITAGGGILCNNFNNRICIFLINFFNRQNLFLRRVGIAQRGIGGKRYIAVVICGAVCGGIAWLVFVGIFLRPCNGCVAPMDRGADYSAADACAQANQRAQRNDSGIAQPAPLLLFRGLLALVARLRGACVFKCLINGRVIDCRIAARGGRGLLLAVLNLLAAVMIFSVLLSTGDVFRFCFRRGNLRCFRLLRILRLRGGIFLCSLSFGGCICRRGGLHCFVLFVRHMKNSFSEVSFAFGFIVSHDCEN